MAISCGLALLVVLLVEKPFMKLQKHFLETGPSAAEKRRAAQLLARSVAANARRHSKGGKVELVAPPMGKATST